MTELPVPGQHGGDAARLARALGLDPATVIDLSVSMNPFAPDTAGIVIGELERDGSLINRYPDPASAAALLADAFGVDPDLVVLTNGGAEAIALIAGEHRVGNVIEPEFSLYRRHLAAIDPTAQRWRSNPSNPLGLLAGPGERAGVWDEAFYPLATGRWSRGDAAAWRLGSLTKLWNCPGLRLGYVIAPDVHAALCIRRRQPQWAVNGLALAAIPVLLARTDLTGWHEAIGALRTDFTDALANLGFAVEPTAVNWVLVKAGDLRARLAPRGIVVRDCSSFGLPGLYRVALPTRPQLDRVVASFAAANQP